MRDSDETTDEGLLRLEEWYHLQRPRYEALGGYLVSTIERLLELEGIPYVSVHGRAKDPQSFIEKVRRKNYALPEEDNTDFCGVRIILYLERDVLRAAELIRSTFRVDSKLSADKTEQLGEDRVGYRSLHLVCDIGEQRAHLPECKSFAGLVAEVQVRSALQDAWAQIEHGRRYKFRGAVPPELSRKLALIAGLLEMADQSFNQLAADFEALVQEMGSSGGGANELDLNAQVVQDFTIARISVQTNMKLATIDHSRIREITRDLKLYGIRNTTELSRILSHEFLVARQGISDEQSVQLILRDALIWTNPIRYLRRIKNRGFVGISIGLAQMIKEKHGAEMLQRMTRDFGIGVPSEV